MSEPVDVETRLRHALRETAATVEPAPDAWARVVARTPSRLPRSRRWMLVPAAAVLVAIVLVVALATRSTGPPRLHVTGGSDTPEFVPTWLPSGYDAPARSQDLGGFGSGLACTDGSFVAGRLSCRQVTGSTAWLAPTSGGGGSVVVSTALGSGDAPLLTQLRQIGPSRPVSVRGHAGEVFSAESGQAVTWTERPGVRVTVVATSRTVDLSALLHIARDLRESSVPSAHLPLVVASAGDLAIAAGIGPAHSVCVAPVMQHAVAPCVYTAVRALGFARVSPPGTNGPWANMLYGVFPSGVVRVRVVLEGWPAVDAAAHEAASLPGAYVLVRLPSGAKVAEVDALDAGGRALSVVPGAWTSGELLLDPGPQAFIDGPPIAHGSLGGHSWQLRAEWSTDVISTQLVVDGRRQQMYGTPATGLVQFNDGGSGIVSGTVPLDTGKVRIQAVDGASIETTMVRDNRFPVAFFVARIPANSDGFDLTVYDRAGAVVGREGMRSSSSSSSSSGSGASSGSTPASAGSSGAVSATSVPNGR